MNGKVYKVNKITNLSRRIKLQEFLALCGRGFSFLHFFTVKIFLFPHFLLSFGFFIFTSHVALSLHLTEKLPQPKHVFYLHFYMRVHFKTNGI